MFIFGWALMTTFVLYEKYWAVHPMMPLRVLNRTFLCCVAIDVFYFMSGNMRSTYYSSWTYVVKDWYVINLPNITSLIDRVGFQDFKKLDFLHEHRYCRTMYIRFDGRCYSAGHASLQGERRSENVLSSNFNAFVTSTCKSQVLLSEFCNSHIVMNPADI